MNTWQNRSPGHLDLLLPAVEATPVAPAVADAVRSARAWEAVPLAEKTALFLAIQSDLRTIAESLATDIAREVGKPLVEARGEVTAVLAKFDLTLADAGQHLAEQSVTGGPFPAAVRRCARGPAAVVGPFNFPLHLANGAILAHLIAGNPVLFKPSPLAPLVAGAYGAVLTRHLPPGVFQIVQGHGATGQELCLHPAIRSVCFTGSVAVGRSLAVALADDFSKDLALELGGKNALIIAGDADLAAAARAAADGVCLTAGQRCNATSRILVAVSCREEFASLFREQMARYVPGDPLLENTTLGPVVTAAAAERHARLVAGPGAETVGQLPAGLNGHYVLPAILWRDHPSAFSEEEQFVPVVEIAPVRDLAEAVECQNRSPFGLTASIFTQSEATYRHFAATIDAGNVYANLATTFSPSTLPFGGWKHSGNHRPGGRGFVRFVGNEQALQWTGFASA